MRSKDQEVYKIQLVGIFHIILIVEDIWSSHNILEGSITITCDGINALEKAMKPNTQLSCLLNHFELISAVENKIQAIPTQWSWNDIKGQQD